MVAEQLRRHSAASPSCAETTPGGGVLGLGSRLTAPTLMRGRICPLHDTAWAMDEIMAGNATPAQLAAFAVLLRAKGESPDELAGLVRTMRDRAYPVRCPGRAVDLVGTGGDRAHTVNIRRWPRWSWPAPGVRS